MKKDSRSARASCGTSGLAGLRGWRDRRGGRHGRPARSVCSAARRAVEQLEPRLLFAITTIESSGDPITNITSTDTGVLRVAYQGADGADRELFYDTDVDDQSPLAYSGIFVREEDGTVNGNTEASNFSVAPVASRPLVPDDANGDAQSLTTDAAGRSVLTNRMTTGGSVPFRVVQTITHRPGDAFLRVDNVLTNAGTGPATLDFFFAADLYEGVSDGTGGFDQATGSVTSLGSLDGRTTYLQPVNPNDPGLRYQEGTFTEIWTALAGQNTHFDNSFDAAPQDNGVGLEWFDQTIEGGGSRTYSYFVAFNSPVAAGTAEGPSAQLRLSPLRNQLGETTYNFTVRYASTTQAPIDPATIDAGDVVLRIPGGAMLPAQLVGTAPGSNADDGVTFVDATYQVTSPGGFTTGGYAVELQSNAVRTVTGAAVPGGAVRGLDGQTVFQPAALQVTANADAAALAGSLAPGAVGAGGSGLTITGQSLVSSQQTGAGAASVGTFTNPGGIYNLGYRGIVLSTGDVNILNSITQSPEDDITSANTNFQGTATAAQDALLNPITGANVAHRDVTQLDVAFNADASVTNVFFNVVWGTEEAATNAGEFPDAFGLYLNGQNIARTGSDPINANNPNLASIAGTVLERVIAPNGNPVLSFDISRASGLLRTGANTLQIIISDSGDGDVDSAAFVSALSTTRSQVPVNFDDTFNGGQAVPVEFVSEDVATVGDVVYVAGHPQDGGALVLARLRNNGTLDPAFGGGDGIVETPVSPGGIGSGAYAVLPLPDGTGVLVAGSNGADMVVARYTTAGQLDTSYGSGGIAVLPFAGTNIAYAMTFDGAGRLVVAGSTVDTDNPSGVPAGDLDIAVARLTAGGALDTGFGSGGLATAETDVISADPSRSLVNTDRAGAVQVFGNQIIVAGQAGFQVVVASFDANTGQPTAGFGTVGNGTAIADLTTNNFIVGLAVQGDGRILLAGSIGDPRGERAATNFGIARLNPNGSRDTSFGPGGSGRIEQELGGTDDADSIAILGNGNIFVAGTSLNVVGNSRLASTAVALYDAAGRPQALPQDDAPGDRPAPNSARYDSVPLGAAAAPTGTLGPRAVSIGSLLQNAQVTPTNDPNRVVVTTGTRTPGRGRSAIRRLGAAATTQGLGINDVTVTEGNAGSTAATFNVTLSEASTQAVTVNFATADGSATAADNDYAPLTGIVTFAPGQTTQTVTVNVTGDGREEANEQFSVTLSGATNATIGDARGVATITNDDSDGGNNGGGEPPNPTGALGATVTAALPSAVVAGARTRGRARVVVSNPGSATVTGPVTVALFASTNDRLGPTDTQVTTLTRQLNLRPGRSKAVNIRISQLPAVPDGTYRLIARVTAPDQSVTAVPAGSTVTIAAPFADLSGQITGSVRGALRPGGRVNVPLSVANAGNVATAGVSVALAASADANAGGDVALPTVTRALRVNPGSTKRTRLVFTLPSNLPSGNYFLVASLSPTNGIADPNAANNVLVSGSAFSV